MKSVTIAGCVLMVMAFDRPLSSQAPERVDFARDVQPVLTERCVGCHGPTQQMSGYRLDRRSAALGGVLRSNLMGLSAERHHSDTATDALVRLLRITQQLDGHWSSAYRPPTEASEFTATAVSVRGIQLYGSNTLRARDEKAVRAGATWLANAHPQTTEDRAFRLFGLTWARAAAEVRQSARKELIATQRPDGGWAQLTSVPSDAYATGESLVALSEAGFDTRDPVYRRGVRFLLSTQLVDGSWFVRTRAHPTQIYFESGFPHGLNQYISAAATNWATLALIRAEMLRSPVSFQKLDRADQAARR